MDSGCQRRRVARGTLSREEMVSRERPSARSSMNWFLVSLSYIGQVGWKWKNTKAGMRDTNFTNFTNGRAFGRLGSRTSTLQKHAGWKPAIQQIRKSALLRSDRRCLFMAQLYTRFLEDSDGRKMNVTGEDRE